jgi:glycosyltransferase involved in cell wall biosynthesis
MSKIAVCIPTKQDQNHAGRLKYPLQSLALQSFQNFTVYIRDEGHHDAFADNDMRLLFNLLAIKGIKINYLRTFDRQGVGHARRALVEAVAEEPFLLWLDDDMIIEPGAIAGLVRHIEGNDSIGFVQGVKKELDPFRSYYQDINLLNEVKPGERPFQIYFGDTAFLLMRTEAVKNICWDLVTRYSIEGLTGEDVTMSLLVAQNYEGWGIPEAVGYHLSPNKERWLWEPHSDALQLELLRGKVDPEILKKAIPHLAPFVDKNK